MQKAKKNDCCTKKSKSQLVKIYDLLVEKLLYSTGFDAESKDVLGRLSFLLSIEIGFMWNDAYAFVQLDILLKDATLTDVLTKMYGLGLCHTKI